MTSPVETIDPDATIDEAASRLAERHIGSLVVGEDRVDGIVTETDIVAAVAAGLDPTATLVRDRMSEPVVTIRPDAAVGEAGERMGNNAVKKLPVTRDGRPLGIVTTTDLAYHLPEYRVEMAAHEEPDIEKGEFE